MYIFGVNRCTVDRIQFIFLPSILGGLPRKCSLQSPLRLAWHESPMGLRYPSQMSLGQSMDVDLDNLDVNAELKKTHAFSP